MDIQVTEFPGIKVACVRHTGSYEKCKPAWDKLCRWASNNHLLSPATTFLGICHDDPLKTNPDKIRYDACVSINNDVVSDGDVEVKIIEAGIYVKAVHVGSCEKLKDTYAYIFKEWIPSNGKKVIAAPCMEIYRNDPDTTPEEDWITELYIPIHE
ncbi:MAG: hypothetical protein GY804_13295 [Alphaproteobacteria bacterium]|nr:hypothetical protein [Alphaproteobacteria bacterium]